MRTLIAYESMFGNTHVIAAEIASGFEASGSARLESVHNVTPALLEWADLFIVGGPTHAHGLTSAQSRQGAYDTAAKSDGSLTLDPDAEGPGLRDFFRDCMVVDGKLAAAFDTRYDASPLLTGRASRGIAKRLVDRGFRLAVEPESFLVDKHNGLLPGEDLRAMRWGIELSNALATSN
jgi:hypothetical protein